MTFAAVSVLVMLIRQTMGCKLSNFDLYLIITYVSLGFAVAAAALLPPLVALFAPTAPVLRAIASGLAAVFMAVATANSMRFRDKAATVHMSGAVRAVFVGYWLSALALLINAVVPPVQSVGVHAAAVTFFLLVLMTAFVPRAFARTRKAPPTTGNRIAVDPLPTSRPRRTFVALDAFSEICPNGQILEPA
jgi:hypothetical protein